MKSESGFSFAITCQPFYIFSVLCYLWLKKIVKFPAWKSGRVKLLTSEMARTEFQKNWARQNTKWQKKRLGQNTNKSFAFCPHLMITCQDVYREKMSELWTWICCIFPVTAKNAVLALDHKEQIPTIKWFCQVAKIDADTNNARVAEALRTEE